VPPYELRLGEVPLPFTLAGLSHITNARAPPVKCSHHLYHLDPAHYLRCSRRLTWQPHM